MTHQQFLDILLSENSNQPTFPTSGLTLKEAILRWVGYAATCHWWNYYRPARAVAVPFVRALHWRFDEVYVEDVDISLPAVGRDVHIKIKAGELDQVNVYSLRLFDFESRDSTTATGLVVRDGSRLSIRPTEDGYLWPLPDPVPAQPPVLARPRATRRREPETLSFPLEPCCLAALARIRRCIRTYSVLQALVGIYPWARIFGVNVSAAGMTPIRLLRSGRAVYQLQAQDWDSWQAAVVTLGAAKRANVQLEAEAELSIHENDSDLNRFWTIVHDSVAVPEDH